MFPEERDTTQLSYAAQCIHNLKGLSILSLNICSVVRKFDSLKYIISSSEPDIFALNETFLNHLKSLMQLEARAYVHQILK